MAEYSDVDRCHLLRTFVVDLPVAVDVGLADHLVHFLVSQLLAQVRHHVPQLGRRDEAVPVLVEHPAGREAGWWRVTRPNESPIGSSKLYWHNFT